MIEITPAILEKDLSAIEEKLILVQGGASCVQIDVVDGIFASSRSWPYTSRETQEEFKRIAAGDEGLPLWSDFDFEADLMVSHPEKVVQEWISAGVARVVVHMGSEGAREALDACKPWRQENAPFPVLTGIALPSSASAEDLGAFDGLFDFVQVMGIEEIGHQGKPFDRRSLALLEGVRALYPSIPLQVDGGVSRENVQDIVSAGASRLIIGSTIFGSEDPRGELEKIKKEVGS